MEGIIEGVSKKGSQLKKEVPQLLHDLESSLGGHAPVSEYYLGDTSVHGILGVGRPLRFKDDQVRFEKSTMAAVLGIKVVDDVVLVPLTYGMSAVAPISYIYGATAVAASDQLKKIGIKTIDRTIHDSKDKGRFFGVLRYDAHLISDSSRLVVPVIGEEISLGDATTTVSKGEGLALKKRKELLLFHTEHHNNIQSFVNNMENKTLNEIKSNNPNLIKNNEDIVLLLQLLDNCNEKELDKIGIKDKKDLIAECRNKFEKEYDESQSEKLNLQFNDVRNNDATNLNPVEYKEALLAYKVHQDFKETAWCQEAPYKKEIYGESINDEQKNDIDKKYAELLKKYKNQEVEFFTEVQGLLEKQEFLTQLLSCDKVSDVYDAIKAELKDYPQFDSHILHFGSRFGKLTEDAKKTIRGETESPLDEFCAKMTILEHEASKCATISDDKYRKSRTVGSFLYPYAFLNFVPAALDAAGKSWHGLYTSMSPETQHVLSGVNTLIHETAGKFHQINEYLGHANNVLTDHIHHGVNAGIHHMGLDGTVKAATGAVKTWGASHLGWVPGALAKVGLGGKAGMVIGGAAATVGHAALPVGIAAGLAYAGYRCYTDSIAPKKAEQEQVAAQHDLNTWAGRAAVSKGQKRGAER